MNDLQAAHCPSLQPCMGMTPCSAAARRIVWSSATSISIPTGSNRTWGLSVIPVPSGLRRRAPGRALAVVVGDEGRALLVGHLVEQHVRRLHLGHPAQV